jgi:hypothetical protein
MSRTLLVWLLAALVAVGGCSSRQSAAATVATDAEEKNSPDLNRFCRYPDWLDNYPVLRGLVYTSTLFGLGVVALHPMER